MADSSIPTHIAETIQVASINPDPSPHHDLNPSTAASTYEPVDVVPSPPTAPGSTSASGVLLEHEHAQSSQEDEHHIITEEDDVDDDIPLSVLRPLPRRGKSGGGKPHHHPRHGHLAQFIHDHQPGKGLHLHLPGKHDDDDNDDDGGGHRRPKLPPMPDLRFEQSYLRSIAAAADDGRWGRVAWITARDQVLMPLAQGVLYNLAICGWQHWNRTARYGGASLGARLRRWWYRVNNWPLPREARR